MCWSSDTVTALQADDWTFNLETSYRSNVVKSQTTMSAWAKPNWDRRMKVLYTCCWYGSTIKLVQESLAVRLFSRFDTRLCWSGRSVKNKKTNLTPGTVQTSSSKYSELSTVGSLITKTSSSYHFTGSSVLMDWSQWLLRHSKRSASRIYCVLQAAQRWLHRVSV